MSTKKSPEKAKKKEINPARARFARLLVQKRKERGFPTAYAFFHKNGGLKNFRFSYYYYLLIERGLRLPSEPALQGILDALGNRSAQYEARKELLILYVRALVGGSPFFDPVFEGVAEGPGPHAPAADAPAVPAATADEEILRIATRRNIRNVPRMSVEQVEAMMSSAAAYWIFHWLNQTGRRGTAAELARELRLRPDEITPAVNSLLAHKLIEKRKDGSFASPHFETDLFEPMAMLGPEKLLWFSSRLQERVRAEGRGHFYSYFVLSVEDERRLATMAQLFRDTLSKIYLLRPDRPVKEGVLVGIEARVSTLFPVEKE